MGQNLTEKIVQKFVFCPDEEVRCGDYVYIQPKFIMTHDNTTAVLDKFETFACKISNAKQIVFTLDHDIQNTSIKNIAKYTRIQEFAAKNNIAFYPAGRGIGHQVMCEEGYILPNTLVVASDSHSNMYGGLGCLGTPVTRTDAAAIWATGKTWWQVPPVARVELTGKLQKGVTGKDIIVALCGVFANDEVLNYAIEFCGEAIEMLSIEERLTIANMTTEWGALSGLFPVDQKLIHWYRDSFPNRINSKIVVLSADEDAHYAKKLSLDISSIGPSVSGPNAIKKMTPVSQLRQKKIAIDKAYLVSCVNSRVSDIAVAAEILAGKKIATGVKFYLAAASSKVQQESENRGDWQKLVDAGAIVLPSGCGPCIGLGQGLVEDNEVAISATNRNFKGRMGSRNASVYLASPAVVAYSALQGYIDYPGEWQESFTISCEVVATNIARGKNIVLDGFPTEIFGRGVFCRDNNINTDGIYPGKYTYDESISPEQQAKVAMENYSEDFQSIACKNDILIGGFNFGTGSSREQAATCLKYKGFQAIIAGSFSDTYKRNALNNGLIVIESSSFVDHLQKQHQEKCLRLENELHICFNKSVITYDNTTFSFVPLGKVAQELVLNNGLIEWIKRQINV